MTVFGNSGTGKQVFPIDYQSEVSQRLLDASHINDLKSAFECVDDPFVDVNFVGTVSLKAKKTEVLLHHESAHEVRVEYQEFKTDVSALFLTAHTGNLKLVRKLLVARENGKGKDAENVILDELARQLVSEGTRVKKHTKCWKGTPHFKSLRMVNGTGILQWGKSSKRNVICRGAEVGASIKFRWNRRRKFDVEDPGMFHVMTTKKKEVHFVCEGGVEMAELWVGGIKLVTKEAIFGRKNE